MYSRYSYIWRRIVHNNTMYSRYSQIRRGLYRPIFHLFLPCLRPGCRKLYHEYERKVTYRLKFHQKGIIHLAYSPGLPYLVSIRRTVPVCPTLSLLGVQSRFALPCLYQAYSPGLPYVVSIRRTVPVCLTQSVIVLYIFALAGSVKLKFTVVQGVSLNMKIKNDHAIGIQRLQDLMQNLMSMVLSLKSISELGFQGASRPSSI